MQIELVILKFMTLSQCHELRNVQENILKECVSGFLINEKKNVIGLESKSYDKLLKIGCDH